MLLSSTCGVTINMIEIYEKWVYINMNKRDKRVGDCVARSLSLAYNMDYDDTKKELLALKKELNYGTWKYSPVWKTFMQNHEGDGRQDQLNPPTSDTTVAELADKNSNGTLVVLCKDPDPKSGKTHLVTIIDGNIYDTWNSSDWIVKNYWKVTTNAITNPDMDTDEYIEYTNDCVTKYIKEFSDKYKITYWYDGPRIKSVKGFEIRCKVDYIYQIPDGEENEQLFDIPYKLSPSYSDDKNRQIIDSVSKQWVRWYIRNISKHIQEVLDNRDLHNSYSDKFYGSYNDRQLRKQLPFWCQKLITFIDQREGSGDWYKYIVGMQALPGDPRGNEDVTFYADSWSELKGQIDDYKKNFSRYGYDY